MLEAPNWGDSLRLHGPAPLEIDQVQNEQIVEPVLAVSSTEDEHHVLDDAGCVELAHRRFAADDAGDVEGEFIDALFEIDEDHVREDLEAIPAAIDDDLRPVPELARVAHSRLGQFVFVHFRLEPMLLF